MREKWKYNGPIFDAHTHIGNIEDISKMIDIEDDFGVKKQVGIVHDEEGFRKAKKEFPNRFIFAKYLSLSDIARYKVKPVLEEISRLKSEGYSIAKMWFGPRWRDYYEVPKHFQISHQELEPIFQALDDNGVPLIIHVGDPDTYYNTHYKDSEKYGTKNGHLDELKNVISRHPRLKFQIPHFGSQPEINRLSHLEDWMINFPNIIVDTASSRWMARELSKNVKKARRFITKHSDRIIFGTDISSSKGEHDYFSGRYTAQRILWDTGEHNIPLPFPDADTEDIGGTFINGLDLPLSVLKKLYWENANRFYKEYIS